MYDLIVAAFQTDSTRVMTYRQPVSNLLTSLGIKVAPHDMSHYSPGEREEASKQRDLAQSELLAGLIDRLKATKETDGSRLFDNTCVVFGSNIRSVHYLDNCPTILAGGGAGNQARTTPGRLQGHAALQRLAHPAPRPRGQRSATRRQHGRDFGIDDIAGFLAGESLVPAPNLLPKPIAAAARSRKDHANDILVCACGGRRD